MGDQTVWLKHKILNLQRGQSFAAPVTMYAALFSVAPDDNYTEAVPTGTEATYPGYARRAVTFDAPAAGIMNGQEVVFDPATGAAPAPMIAFGLFDALTGGNLWRWKPITSMSIDVGDQPKIAAAGLIESED